MLLLHHDDTFTKGIILNRPSALEVDGWRAWCGHGQVAEGGIFVGEERKTGQLEINALHSLAGAEADKVSTRVIKGVSYTSLENAKALVAAGVAEKSDFWVCVGYSGWAPGQLASEVETRVLFLCNAHCNTPIECNILNALQHTATHCNTLHHTATHCNTLQHAATHCTTVQHSALHYIIPFF